MTIETHAIRKCTVRSYHLPGLFSIPLLVMLLVASGFAAQTERLEQALLSRDWPGVVQMLDGDQGKAKDPAARLLMAHAYLATNKNNNALTLFLSAKHEKDLVAWDRWTGHLLTKAPTNPVALYLAADARARQGDLAKADELLSQGIKGDPSFAMAYSARGVLRTLAGQWDMGEVDFDLATRLAPMFADSHANKGVLSVLRTSSFSMGRSGLEAFDTAVALDPEFALAFNGRGCLYLGNAMFEEASHDFQKAARLSPLLAVAEVNQGLTTAYEMQARALANTLDRARPGTSLTTVREEVPAQIKQENQWRFQNLTPAGDEAELQEVIKALPYILQSEPKTNDLIKKYGIEKVVSMVELARNQRVEAIGEMNRSVQNDHSKIAALNWAIMALKTADAITGLAVGGTKLVKSAEEGWKPLLRTSAKISAKSGVSSMIGDNTVLRAILEGSSNFAPAGLVRNTSRAGASLAEYGRDMTGASQEDATRKVGQLGAEVQALDQWRKPTYAAFVPSTSTGESARIAYKGASVPSNSPPGWSPPALPQSLPQSLPYRSSQPGSASGGGIFGIPSASNRQRGGPGGVSTEELAKSFVDKGNWPVMTMFTLSYPVPTRQDQKP